MKVSRVVMIVLALHVLVIGGIFIFEGCKGAKSDTPPMAAHESDATTTASESATPAIAPVSVPTPMPVAPAPEPPAATTYIVKKGDSLWKIAKENRITVAELAKANNMDRNSMLRIGQTLQIPASAPAPTAAASVIPTSAATDSSVSAAASSGEGHWYSVKSGDSLWKIAKTHDTTVAALREANALKSDTLRIGQKLRIPSASSATASAATSSASMSSRPPAFREPGTYEEGGRIIHVVDVGESPALIAKKYGIRTADLMAANNISDPKNIHYGQTLIIPKGETTAIPTTANAVIN
jgi:LysM repeat protein